MSIKKKILKSMKKDIDIVRKKSKIKRKPFPVMRSAYQRKHKIPGYTFKSPGPVYSGAYLHYIDKNGRIKHDGNRSVAEVKKDTMSVSEFKKRFYDPEKVEKN